MITSKFHPYLEIIVLILLIFIVSGINLSWIIKDTRLQPMGDPYPQKIIEFSNKLATGEIYGFSRAITHLSLGFRPPLYQLMAVPFVYLFGRSCDAILLLNIIMFAGMILATYGAGTLAAGRRAGLLAAFIVSTYPPLVNLVKIARPHSILPAFTALCLWSILWLIKTRSIRVAWFFGISLGLGVLLHPNFIYVFIFPAIIWIGYLVFFQNMPRYPVGIRSLPRWLGAKLGDRLVILGVLPGMILAVFLAAWWYLPHWERLMALASHSAIVWSGVSYGFPEVPVSFWWYFRTMPGAITIIFTVLLWASIAILMLRSRLTDLILITSFLLALGVISWRKGAMAWMNGAAILPIAAVLTAAGLIRLRDFYDSLCSASRHSTGLMKRCSRIVWLLLLTTSIASGLFSFFVITWGIPPHCEGIARILGSPLNSSCWRRMIVAFCPNPARKEDWETSISNILKRISQDSEDGQGENLLAVISIEAEGLKNVDLRFFLVRDFPDLKTKIEPICQTGGIRNLSWLTGRYLVYTSGALTYSYSRAVTELMLDPPQIFKDTHKEICSFELPHGKIVYLLKRVKELTLLEAEISIRALKYINLAIKNQLLEGARNKLGGNPS